MSYQALYRKWRPQTFGEIVGQEAVATTLRHAIAAGKSSHAYLFTGPRGTGKTSAAKIVAKAVNCLNPHDGEPCNACRVCRAINDGTLADVIEIDAASNNGVDKIREIRDKVRYAPTEAANKVYIIDEVHMLSTGAFNALLKTLEEPPANVIFILATTEWQKIPATVISRTQRFDFKRIDIPTLKARMQEILKAEGVEYEDAALDVVARTANGGMRDALSILDQLLSFSEGKLLAADARTLTGALSAEEKIQYVRALQDGDAETALRLLRELLQAGKEASRFIEEMMRFTRDLLMAKQVAQDEMAALGATYDDDFYTLAQATEPALLYRMMTTWQDTRAAVRFSSQPDIYLEVATIELAAVPETTDADSASTAAMRTAIESLQATVADLKAKVNATPQNERPGAPQRTERQPKAQRLTPPPTPDFVPETAAIYQTLADATKEDRATVVRVWGDLTAALGGEDRALLAHTKPVAASAAAFVVIFERAAFCRRVAEKPELLAAVQAELKRRADYDGRMLVLTAEQWDDLRRRYVDALHKGTVEELIQQAKDDAPAKPADTKPTPDNTDQTQAQPETKATTNEPSTDPVVQSAADLFGSDNIDVIDD